MPTHRKAQRFVTRAWRLVYRKRRYSVGRVLSPFRRDSSPRRYHLTHCIWWPFHCPEVHASEIFADHSQCKKLSSGKDGDNRGHKGEPRNAAALYEVISNNV